MEQVNAVRYILRLQDPPPYLVEGPLPVTNIRERPQYVNNSKELSRTGVLVRETVLHICQTTPSSQILMCAPLNSTCDMLMRSLQKEIPESASCPTEPETTVPPANLANETMASVITSAPKSRSGWGCSNIARQNGLMRSYFERLHNSEVYKSLDPTYITKLKDVGWK
ncbi:hypothetical protein LguiA_002937 [Lonicera macranthoides]